MAGPVAEAEIDIEAPIDRVWGVMLDVARYPEWNPFIVRIDADSPRVAVGAWLALHVRWGDGGGVVSREMITRIEPPAADGAGRSALLEYRFGGPISALGLVRGERVQSLTERGPGATRYRTQEVFRGLLTAFVPIARVRDGFARHARALKDRAESLSP